MTFYVNDARLAGGGRLSRSDVAVYGFLNRCFTLFFLSMVIVGLWRVSRDLDTPLEAFVPALFMALFVIAVLVSDAKARKANTEYLRLVAVAVTERMLGYPLERENRAQGEFLPRVMLEEEILLALGRCGEPMAIELLLSAVANPKNRHRAAACLALGMVGRKSAAPTLARFLLDGDPWVRFTASLSLAHLTGESPSVDWMYGNPATRLAAAEAWMQRVEGER
jgi:hypothetical protein